MNKQDNDTTESELTENKIIALIVVNDLKESLGLNNQTTESTGSNLNE